LQRRHRRSDHNKNDHELLSRPIDIFLHKEGDPITDRRLALYLSSINSIRSSPSPSSGEEVVSSVSIVAQLFSVGEAALNAGGSLEVSASSNRSPDLNFHQSKRTPANIPMSIPCETTVKRGYDTRPSRSIIHFMDEKTRWVLVCRGKQFDGWKKNRETRN